MTEAEKKLPEYSVLMQVYDKVPPEQFRQAAESMLTQTHQPCDLVLICDGRLTGAQEQVISSLDESFPGVLNVCRFEQGITVGAGSNHGLPLCRCRLVARMDADDIALPERCRLEAEQFMLHPELDIVGGFIEEFKEGQELQSLLREVPLTHEEILTYARRRTPFNNVTVMMKKDAALAVGGYRDLTRAEDYDLYCRMLQNGAKGANIAQTLVRCRVSADGYERRRGWEHAKSLISVRWDLYKMGFTRLSDFLVMTAAHIFVFLMPASFTDWLYSRHLRSAKNKAEEPEYLENDLGRFVKGNFGKTNFLYEAAVEWCDKTDEVEAEVVCSPDAAEKLDESFDFLREIMSRKSSLDGKLKEYIADWSTEEDGLVHIWGGDIDEEPEPMKREEFIAALHLSYIRIYEDATAEFVFPADGLYTDHDLVVRAERDLSFTECVLEG